MRIKEQKYLLPDGREVTIKSVGPEDAMKYLHRAYLGMSIRLMYTGMGLGSFMMQIALEQAKANGFEQVELGVYSDNDRARHMYRKMGFREYGMNPRAFKLKDGTYRDEIIMANIFES